MVPIKLSFIGPSYLVFMWTILCVSADDRSPKWGDWTKWGDQGDGAYRNPVIPSDYSDIDCIWVGSDYYAVSSTFHFSPGFVILHSKDLVNWAILVHVVSRLTFSGFITRKSPDGRVTFPIPN